MSEFDEAAARKHFGMNSDCIDTSNDLECFVEGARWQHTQDQSALQALQSELAECRVARADMANQIALYNRDSDDRHNEMALLHKEVARLEAEVEQSRQDNFLTEKQQTRYKLYPKKEFQCLSDENSTLRKLLGEAAEALSRYGEHTDQCLDSLNDVEDVCICGLDVTHAKLTAALGGIGHE